MDVSHSVLYLYIQHKVSILIEQNNYFVSNHKLPPSNLLWLPQV